MSIPKGHRADEFSLNIRWRPRSGRGDSIAADWVPGFYLSASFANEGMGHDVVKDQLLTPQTLQNILTTASCRPRHMESALMNVGKNLNAAVHKAQHERLAALAVRVRTAREELAKHEQALRDAGLDPNAV